MADPAEVAAGLTKAQREAVVWLGTGNVAASDAFCGHSKEQPRRSTLNCLLRNELAECSAANSYWQVTISPLGLATRAALLDMEARNGR